MSQTWDAEAYAQNGAFVPALATQIVEWLGPQPGEHILDLGCGDGNLTSRLIQSGARVEGVDSSSTMVATARLRGITVVEASAEALPHPDASFDAVFSNAALHWVRNQDAMLAHVHRVLRPHGRFVAEMGGHGNIAAIRVALIAVLMRHGYSDAEDGVNYYPTPDAYTRRLTRHGLHVERIELIPRPTPIPGGMTAWLNTFRRGVLDSLPEELQHEVIEETEELLARALRDEAGNWVADYVRLRFIARAI